MFIPKFQHTPDNPITNAQIIHLQGFEPDLKSMMRKAPKVIIHGRRNERTTKPGFKEKNIGTLSPKCRVTRLPRTKSPQPKHEIGSQRKRHLLYSRWVLQHPMISSEEESKIVNTRFEERPSRASRRANRMNEIYDPKIAFS